MNRRGTESVSDGSYNRKRHLGVDFLIWRRENGWFWFLVNPRDDGRIIGTTVSEARAIHEACLSIEAILAIS
jgi:hypothetical protein